MSVLVVGQDEDTFKAISSALDPGNYQVHRVADAKEGLTRLASRVPYKIVITDLELPGMTGLQFLRHVRGNPKLRKTPILVCSAVGDALTVMQAIESGAGDYIVKPVDSDALRSKVERLIGNKQADVLVVDDDPMIRDLLVRILSREGFSVVAVPCVDDAIETMSTTRFSVVISDIEMPDRSGLDLLHHIRQNSPRLPVLMITGKAEKYGQKSIMNAGATGFIT